MSEQNKKEPWDELVKSVLGVIEADQMELEKVRKERDDWKDRYFKQADRIDSVRFAISKMEDDATTMGKAVNFLIAAAFVNLVFLSVIIVRIAFYGGGQ
jgi:hypothetical protein